MKKEFTQREINDFFKKIAEFDKNIKIQEDHRTTDEKPKEEKAWIIADNTSSFNNIKECING